MHDFIMINNFQTDYISVKPVFTEKILGYNLKIFLEALTSLQYTYIYICLSILLCQYFIQNYAAEQSHNRIYKSTHVCSFICMSVCLYVCACACVCACVFLALKISLNICLCSVSPSQTPNLLSSPILHSSYSSHIPIPIPIPHSSQSPAGRNIFRPKINNNNNKTHMFRSNGRFRDFLSQ